jgi:hypothetical protein
MTAYCRQVSYVVVHVGPIDITKKRKKVQHTLVQCLPARTIVQGMQYNVTTMLRKWGTHKYK